MKALLSNNVFSNGLWFLLSLITAFFIWVIATFQVDPIVVQRLPFQVPIQIQLDDGFLITNTPRDTVSVTVRGQQSAVSALTLDDVTVIAALGGLDAGDHTVPLSAEIAGGRRVAIDSIAPSQLRVVVEEVSQRFVNVQAIMTDSIPVGYEHDPPLFDTTQVLISGAASQVARVVAVQAQIGLANRRNSFQETVRVVPVDENGVVIAGLTLDPIQVTVSVIIRQREDIREVAITPNILIDALPEGYRLTSTTYSPQTILLGGTPQLLENIANTLFTDPIDLTGRTESFEINVSVILPNEELLVLSEQNINVSIGIAPLETTARFDEVPVGTIGTSEGVIVELLPSSVTVLLTGPQPILDDLQAADIQVLLDLNGFTAGNYQLAPTVSISGVELQAENISVLPAEIDVRIISEATPEATAAP
jgi:YbbR domain-containing protein